MRARSNTAPQLGQSFLHYVQTVSGSFRQKRPKLRVRSPRHFWTAVSKFLGRSACALAAAYGPYIQQIMEAELEVTGGKTPASGEGRSGRPRIGGLGKSERFARPHPPEVCFLIDWAGQTSSGAGGDGGQRRREQEEAADAVERATSSGAGGGGDEETTRQAERKSAEEGLRCFPPAGLIPGDESLVQFVRSGGKSR